MRNYAVTIIFSWLLVFSLTHTCVAAEYSSLEFFHTNKVSQNGEIKAVLKATLNDGWKTYWRFPGESGLPPRFNWQESENIEGFEVYFPAPERFSSMGIENIGYSQRVDFPVVIKLKDASKKAVLKLDVELLMCKLLCVPDKHKLEVYLDESSAGGVENINQAFAFLPKKLAEGSLRGAWISQDYDGLYLNLQIDGDKTIKDVSELFVENPAQFIVEPPYVFVEKGLTNLKAKILHYQDMQEIKNEILNKSFFVTLKNREGSYEAGGIFLDVKADEAQKCFISFKLLLLAFVGGFILNLMPCVLPVLSIKLLSVLKHKESGRKKIRESFLFTSLGIISSFWLLATLVSFLKFSGEAVGWGMQFQNNWFISALVLVLLFFAANLWGLFELRTPRFIDNRFSGSGVLEDFFSGAFATLLATPCSAPFLGTAIGFALTKTMAEIFVIFTFIGLGLSLPYVLLAFSPGFFKYLPKPGRWMVVLRKVLSITVLATALWLATVAFADISIRLEEGEWQVFDRALISPAVEEEKIVFVDVTANWCLTCKANKLFTLETEEVKNILSADNVLKLRADWTKKDDEILKYLQRHGRFGVPFNIIYSLKYPEGLVLPEILTKSIVMEYMNRAR